METTHAQLAAKCLRDAAFFFRKLGSENPPISVQMEENADVFEEVARLVESSPLGVITTE